MTNSRKTESNRRNSLASTGPRTSDGRATSSQNAVRHGILARIEVLPGVERAEDWNQHLDATLEDLRAAGHLEILLAERVALILWRLGRVARYERDATAIALERVDKDSTDVLVALADPEACPERRAVRLQRERILPQELGILDKVMRYENHLERSLFRTLHELERLRAARSGGATAPVTVDVTVDNGAAA